MGIISLNEKRTASNSTHTTGREKSYFSSDKFKEVVDDSWQGVTSNLVLHLDAGDSSSYSGSGSTWSDISGNGHTAALHSSPTYSSTVGGGSFLFDGVNDYGTITDDIDFLMGYGSFTEEAWHYRSSTSGWEVVLQRGSDASWGGTWINNSGNAHPYHYTHSTGTITYSTSISMRGSWVHHVVTTENSGTYVRLKVYKNGSHEGTTTNYTSSWRPKNIYTGTTTKLYIGGGSNTSYRYTGRIAIIRLYKGKALSASEVLQNYNLEKSRFGH